MSLQNFFFFSPTVWQFFAIFFSVFFSSQKTNREFDASQNFKNTRKMANFIFLHIKNILLLFQAKFLKKNIPLLFSKVSGQICTENCNKNCKILIRNLKKLKIFEFFLLNFYHFFSGKLTNFFDFFQFFSCPDMEPSLLEL